jgi:hypothetical protein
MTSIATGYHQTFASTQTVNLQDPLAENIRVQTIPIHAMVRYFGFLQDDPGAKRYVGFGGGLNLSRAIFPASLGMTAETPGLNGPLSPAFRVDGVLMATAGAVRPVANKWYVDFGYSVQLGSALWAGSSGSTDEINAQAAFKRLATSQLFLFHLRLGYLTRGSFKRAVRRYDDLQ